MKVVVVHSRYRSEAPSGENRVVDQESAALTAHGHDVRLVQHSSDDIPDWPLQRRLALPATAVWNGRVRSEVSAVLADLRPDVVHLHNTFPMITPSVLYSCRDAGVPVVATIHNYRFSCANGGLFRDGRPCHDCLGGKGLQGVRHGCYRGSRLATLPVVAGQNLHRSAWREMVSAYIFLSAAQRDLLQGVVGLPTERVFVKDNLVSVASVVPEPREHQVVYLGRLDEPKGLPFLMQSWDAFRARHPRSTMRLAIAGGGPLAEEVAAWGATRPSVDVLGLLTAGDAIRVLSRSVAAIIPSRCEETFGLVAVEAMVAGTAPIAPARGAFPELVTDGVTGRVYDPDGPDALAEVLVEIDCRPEQFLALGANGRSAALSRFDPYANLEQLLEIYRFAVRNPVTTGSRPRSLDRPRST